MSGGNTATDSQAFYRLIRFIALRAMLNKAVESGQTRETPDFQLFEEYSGEDHPTFLGYKRWKELSYFPDLMMDHSDAHAQRIMTWGVPHKPRLTKSAISDAKTSSRHPSVFRPCGRFIPFHSSTGYRIETLRWSYFEVATSFLKIVSATGAQSKLIDLHLNSHDKLQRHRRDRNTSSSLIVTTGIWSS